MRNPMYIVSVCLAQLLLFAVLYSCKQTQPGFSVPSARYAPYIKAYTGSVISKTSSIRIEMTGEQSAVELNTAIKENPFSFSPSLKGKAYWVSNNAIEFVPDEGQLKPGKVYNATFRLGKFMDVDKDLKKFEFSFSVAENSFRIEMDALRVSPSNINVVSVGGVLRFSDAVEKSDVDKMISVKNKKSQELTIKTEATDNPALYTFAIENINKADKEYNIEINVSGKPLGMDRTETLKITVPPKDEFTFISATKITQPENGIRVIFSEPLDTSQDLDGLINVTEARSLVFQVEDNIVNVYFDPVFNKAVHLEVHAGILSTSKRKLATTANLTLSQESLKPQVKMLNSGTIMPDSKNLIIPFQAVSLNAVDVTVVRIFEDNVLSFLQVNSLSGSSELRRSGRMVHRKKIQLDGNPMKDITRWEEYALDLSEIIKHEPGAVYRVMLSFKKEYSAYPCDNSENSDDDGDGDEDEDGYDGYYSGYLTQVNVEDEDDESVWDIPEGYYSLEYEDYNWRYYNWNESNNPCHPSYYMGSEKRALCNVLATNLGVIVKRNSANHVWVAVSDILTTIPVEGASVTAYNYQLQIIGTTTTDKEGFAELEPKGVPFAIVVGHGDQKTYLKVIDGEEKSTSRFDVGGKEIKKGLKGFIYGERGVWRPGDTLHISFMLEDPGKRIPANHPVTIELYNPRGQFYNKQISSNGINGVYAFHIPTRQDDPTGLWNSYVKVGGTTFHKSLRVEAIKPNRLKINLQLPDNELIKASKGSVKVDLSSNWLTGANAGSLKTKVEMSLSKTDTRFKNYSQYNFNNPATSFESYKEDVYQGTLNDEGKLTFDMRLPDADNAPGMLRATVTTRVFEPGGDASINSHSVAYSPFDAYVGVNLNQPARNKWIETDTDHVFDVVTVDPEGKPVNRSNLEYKVYRIGWSWWWERRGESFESYVNSGSYTPELSGYLETKNGKGKITFRIDYPDWGRYLVYVKDRNSGHASGGVVYVDWPGWRGRSDKTDPSGVSMLSFSVDKESYETGDIVTAIIPAASEGKALVAIENGSTVLHREWINISGGEDTKYRLKLTPGMAPNVYMHITMLQAHAQTVNELPIRMYGVVPIFVVDKQTILEPKIDMPDVLYPEREFTVKVSEKNGTPMTYTIAVVDDGLLDLTNFKTPDPWSEFYGREALGIRTWDMYDDVVGAWSGSYSSLFGIGGDEYVKNDTKANRFRPVVKHLGPFALKKKGSNTHKITLPMYVGSVRTMVVAGQDAAYGNAEKTTPVRSPLMILSSLPRVLSIGEKIQLPVNVFAMENSVKNVTVTVETSANLKLNTDKQSVTFAETGDKMVFFTLNTGMTTGKEIVKIKAAGNGHTAEETIEIEVRNPNPVVTRLSDKLLSAGESTKFSYELEKENDDNWVRLEASRIPPVDINRRFDFLYNYEHYCSEQLTSRALPLLFISQFKDMSSQEQENTRKNVTEAIKNLYGRQLSNGGIVYWPGNAQADEWITSYAGMFLVMAAEKGYEVNPGVITKWKNYQRAAAKNWTAPTQRSDWYHWQSDLQQSFRLYTLALAGQPELGAMNRMKEVENLSLQARWRLAAAYALAGKETAAGELIFNARTEVEAYSSYNSVYGSYFRDEAMILETLVLMKREREAFEQAKRVSVCLSTENYFSTQSTAFGLMAMGRLAETVAGSIDFGWKLNGKEQKAVKSAKAVYEIPVTAPTTNGSVEVTNNGKGALYTILVSRTRLLNDTLPAMSNNLSLNVKYTDMEGNPISVDNLKQGTDFVAEVNVANISAAENYRDIALTHIIPAGWEIFNERMENPEDGDTTKSTVYDYQDIRDDRVLTYFNLRRDERITIKIRLQASYAGSYVLPAVQCEAMYDVTVNARTRAGRVSVER